MNKLSTEDIRYFQRKYEKQLRLKTVLILSPLILALLLYLFRDTFQMKYLFVYNVVLATLIATSAFGLLMLYLQTGFKRVSLIETSFQVNTFGSENIGSVGGKVSSLEKQMKNLIKDFEQLKLNVEGSVVTDFSEEQKQELFMTLKAKLESESSETIFKAIEEKVKVSLKSNSLLVSLHKSYEEIINRLSREVSALNRRSNLNLVLGILISIVGIILLYNFVFSSKLTHDTVLSFAVYFIPKVALVIFIETFAYFFLSLYKASLSEIKYYQNEMTKVEKQRISIITALNSDSDNILLGTLQSMLASETNISTQEDQPEIVKESISLIIAKGLEEFKKGLNK